MGLLQGAIFAIFFVVGSSIEVGLSIYATGIDSLASFRMRRRSGREATVGEVLEMRRREVSEIDLLAKYRI